MKKIGDAVDKEVVKNTKFNTLKTKVNKIDKKTLIYINQYIPDKQSVEKRIENVDKQITEVCGLVTTDTFTAAKNAILSVNEKIKLENVCITLTDYNKFMKGIFVAKIKNGKLVNESVLNENIKTLATKQ